MKTIVKNGLDVAAIDPQRGSKYSPNLYQWLTSKRIQGRVWAIRVYRESNGTLWIGTLEDRELIGSKLNAVLCNGARQTTAAWQCIDAVEVPDFWARYTSVGRCAIDTDHSMGFMNDESRWLVTGDHRSCQWCGKANQTLKRYTEIIQREKWVTADGEPNA